ncbi:uncharacterized protein [Eurosta solidaginis]|uniref:uncharacterized protein n=1 Tax=Eurosta solidaginis TaxID=178769 RepID=UPI0035311BF3
MSKPQPQTRTTQLRNNFRTTAGNTTKRTAGSNPSKAISGSTKVNSQHKATSCTSPKVTNPVLDEKLKRKSTIPARATEQPAVVKSLTSRDVFKPQIKLATKPATIPSKYIRQTTTNSNVPITKTQLAVTPRKSVIGKQPIRAKHNLKITEEVKKRPPTAVKPNPVLDTYHNVTVASPPPRRKETIKESIRDKVMRDENAEPPKRVRTHSLEEEEIIVLRSDSAKRRIEQQILTDEPPAREASVKETNIFDVDANELLTRRAVIKEPVAFEVSLNEPSTGKLRTKSRDASATRSIENRGQAKSEGENENYSDDFESYESDFETGSSAQNDTESDVSPSSICSEDEIKSTRSSSSEEQKSNGVDIMTANVSEDEEESELTQNPVTVIQREKEIDHKLDSGNYEMNSRKHPKLSEITAQMSERTFDSMETAYSVATSDQLDSGISTYANTHDTHGEVDKYVCTYGGYAAFNTHPIQSKRGKQLMSKIQFDTLTFSLFELKPISYEVYMQTYGTLNTTQCSTQTNDDRMSSECQTDSYDIRTMWTQHPPQYDLQTLQGLGGGMNGTMAIQNCCGEVQLEELNSVRALSTDVYDDSLQKLDFFRQSNNNRVIDQQLRRRLHKPTDIERLNSFMLRASHLFIKVLNSTQDLKQEKGLIKCGQYKNSLHEISMGYMQLETNLLSALHVVRVFSSAKHDLIITVHASPPEADVYRSEFSNLLMVWSTSDSSKPLRLLSTWSEVCRAEICYDCADIVVCGLRDGSIAMWDLRETYSFCSKLDGYLTHFAATQSVVPTWSGSTDQSQRLVDIGAVVDVRSFRTPSKAITLGTNRSIQFAALNDSGILSIWTLVETSMKQYEFDTIKTPNTHRPSKRSAAYTSRSRFEYSSPWARVKLIQSAICDLREYLEHGLRRAQTQFEKTKLIFQKEIYSAEALRELNSASVGQHQAQQMQGLRFTGIDTGCERIYVCTNRNFVLTCSKSLKSERFRKININEDCLLFPTALQVLSNENFLAVGLSNGSVRIVNCNQQKLSHQRPDGASLHLDTASSFDDSRRDTSTPRTPDIDPDTGKSCAIQNIILNERRLLTGSTIVAEYDTRPTTAACIALINNQKRPFEIRVYDQQLILSGSALRKDLVQSLQLSSDGWCLFALVNGHIRIYDFYLDREIAEKLCDEKEKRVIDIAVARSSQNQYHLTVLEEENVVEVHLLNQ